MNDGTSTGSPESVATRKHSRARFLLPAFLCLLYVAQGVWFIRTQSLTSDEPGDIDAGLVAWRTGRLDHELLHPPMPRLFFTLPLLGGNWQIEWKQPRQLGSNVIAIRPSPEGLAWRARLPNLLLGLVLAGLLWWAASRMFSEGAANFLLGFFVFSPDLIAHFSLATTDGAAVLMIFLTPVQIARWRRNPSRRQTIFLGLVLGGLLAAKLYTVPLFALALALVLILNPDRVIPRPRDWNWRKACLAAGVALLVLWATYFFHISLVTIRLRDARIAAEYTGWREQITKEKQFSANFSFPVPAIEYVQGLLAAKRVSQQGHPAFFLGEVSREGWKLYYPAAALLKWPIIVWLLFLGTVALTLRGRVPIPRDGILIALFPLLFFVFICTMSRLNIGVRYVLPVFPFLLLFAGGFIEWARSRRVLRTLVLAAVFLQAGDCLRYAPDYLSYFNIFVNPQESYQLLTDSNLDWGQGLIALREYQRQHPQEEIHLAYFGDVDPSVYGINYRPLLEGDRVTGTVVISASNLSGQPLRNPTSYHWILRFPRKAILNHTLHVFDVSSNP